MEPETWQDILALLRDEPCGAYVVIPRGRLPHPLAAGMTEAIGLPIGQRADYRFRISGGKGLHVQDFGDHYEAHIDRVHPGAGPVDHLRQDAPKSFIAGTVALGTIIGGSIGKTWKSGLAGGAIAGVIGALLAGPKE